MNVDERVDALLAQFTLEEKAALTGGAATWYGAAIPRLGLPPLKVTDGPIGARGAHFGSGASAACFPNASALGATWNPALVREVGAALGEEARTKHAHVLLGPTVNMHRSPLGGRHFEAYSEDPCLASALAAAFVRGVQSRGVAACVKHFVCNDSEFERMTISSEVDERALREIYLPPFEAAVRDAGAWSVMAAYNGLNGPTCSANSELLRRILKQEWGFDGLVMSDWFGTKDTLESAKHGLDLEMPGPARFLGVKLAEAVRTGQLPEAVVDDAARRMLRLMARTGALDAVQPEPPEQAVDLPQHRALARRAASEAIVLLRNEPGADGAALLPLRRGALRRIAVIGPNAERTAIQGGGSARVHPHYETHVLDALRAAAGPNCEVRFALGCSSHKLLPTLPAERTRSPSGEPGFRADFFANATLGGEPAFSRGARHCDWTWLGEVDPRLDPRAFSARFTAHFTPATSGAHAFSLICAGRARLFVNGALLVDNWTAPVRGSSYFGFGSREEIGTLALREGESAELVVEYAHAGGANIAGVRLGHFAEPQGDLLAQAEAEARAADVALVVVGLGAEWETEGHDKADMRLPGRQDELVTRVIAANPNTVVVINAGAPLELPWADEARALVWAWYGGQEAGNAVADVLFGAADPGGRLPTTFPQRLGDVPCHAAEETRVYPGDGGKVHYTEGVLAGYRHYDAHGIPPRFAFGHGLSYARFEYGPLVFESNSVRPGETLVAGVEVRNVSDVAGLEVVQAYLNDVDSRLPRPPQELRAFAKLALAPGEARRVRLTIEPRDLCFWDTAKRAWVAEPGAFELRVGRSSRDIRQRARFTLLDDTD